jgi:hypothetical protein
MVSGKVWVAKTHNGAFKERLNSLAEYAQWIGYTYTHGLMFNVSENGSVVTYLWF